MAGFGKEQSFNAEDVAPQAPREPVPVGDYTVVIVDSEEKDNAKGTGSYLQFKMEIIEGDHKGKHLWSRLNLNNPSDQAVGIARAELSSICRAVGVMRPRDSSELHNLPMVIKVGVEKNKETGELTNRIKGYLPRGQSSKTATAAATNKAPATKADPPWKKKAAPAPQQPAAPAPAPTSEEFPATV